MPYFISKPTRREQAEKLAESRARSSQPRAAGVVRRTEEAFEVSERIRRETGQEPVLAVDASAPESVLARIEVAQRMGFKDPESVQELM